VHRKRQRSSIMKCKVCGKPVIPGCTICSFKCCEVARHALR
jgi:predicted nucleic acid-binding Zn ribbon protein